MSMRSQPRRIDTACCRLATTLIEVLVSLTILGLLMAILLPAVQSIRESARRVECTSHLHEIGTAVWNYHATHGMFPPGAGNYGTWLLELLPDIGERNLLETLRPGGSPRWWLLPSSPEAPDLYRCPSDNFVRTVDVNYAGNFGALVQRDGSNGMFRHAGPPQEWPLRMAGDIRARDVTDGLSQTAMIAEVLAIADFGSPSDMRRVDWQTPRRLRAPDEVEAFIDLCLQMPTGGCRL